MIIHLYYTMFYPEREKECMLKDAELMAARSTIAKLEAEISNLRTQNKRARIEYEKDLGCVKEEKDVILYPQILSCY